MFSRVAVSVKCSLLSFSRIKTKFAARVSNSLVVRVDERMSVLRQDKAYEPNIVHHAIQR
jgi:hypothetical protein